MGLWLWLYKIKQLLIEDIGDRCRRLRGTCAAQEMRGYCKCQIISTASFGLQILLVLAPGNCSRLHTLHIHLHMQLTGQICPLHSHPKTPCSKALTCMQFTQVKHLSGGSSSDPPSLCCLFLVMKMNSLSSNSTPVVWESRSRRSWLP